MICPTCGAEVPKQHGAWAGLTMNRVASLGAKLVSYRESVAQIKSRVKAKQIGRNSPEVLRAQREADLKRLASLEEEIPRLSRLWEEMRIEIIQEVVKGRVG